MRHLPFVVEIRFYYRRYWEEKDYKRKLEKHLENLKTQLNNTTAIAQNTLYLLNLEEELSIEYEQLIRESIDKTIEELIQTKGRISYYRLLTKLATSIPLG